MIRRLGIIYYRIMEVNFSRLKELMESSTVCANVGSGNNKKAANGKAYYYYYLKNTRRTSAFRTKALCPSEYLTIIRLRLGDYRGIVLAFLCFLGLNLF